VPVGAQYLVVQPYGHSPNEATIIESFAAIEDAYEAPDGLAERLHQQGADVESFAFRVTDRTFRPLGRRRMQVQ
jgi:hypothetical protein